MERQLWLRDGLAAWLDSYHREQNSETGPAPDAALLLHYLAGNPFRYQRLRSAPLRRPLRAERRHQPRRTLAAQVVCESGFREDDAQRLPDAGFRIWDHKGQEGAPVRL